MGARNTHTAKNEQQDNIESLRNQIRECDVRIGEYDNNIESYELRIYDMLHRDEFNNNNDLDGHDEHNSSPSSYQSNSHSHTSNRSNLSSHEESQISKFDREIRKLKNMQVSEQRSINSLESQLNRKIAEASVVEINRFKRDLHKFDKRLPVNDIQAPIF